MGVDPVTIAAVAAGVGGAALGGTAAMLASKPNTPKVKDSTVLQDDNAAKKAVDAAANKEAALKKQQRAQNSLLSTGGERGSGSGAGGKTALGQ